MPAAGVHKGEGEAHTQVAFSSMAKYMVGSGHYRRFKIVGWPADLQLPQSIQTVDAIAFPSSAQPRTIAQVMRKCYAYCLVYAIYAGAPCGDDSRTLMQFQPLSPSGEQLLCLPWFCPSPCCSRDQGHQRSLVQFWLGDRSSGKGEAECQRCIFPYQCIFWLNQYVQ